MIRVFHPRWLEVCFAPRHGYQSTTSPSRPRTQQAPATAACEKSRTPHGLAARSDLTSRARSHRDPQLERSRPSQQSRHAARRLGNDAFASFYSRQPQSLEGEQQSHARFEAIAPDAGNDRGIEPSQRAEGARALQARSRLTPRAPRRGDLPRDSRPPKRRASASAPASPRGTFAAAKTRCSIEPRCCTLTSGGHSVVPRTRRSARDLGAVRSAPFHRSKPEPT